jgi:subtilisin family serine protease
MLKKSNLLKIFIAFGYLFFNGCGSTAPILSTPIENIDQTPVKISDLSEKEEQSWSHLDLIKDTIPGVSLELAYEKLVKPKSKTVIVAVIDSGIDISHEDLNANVWINENEIPNNGIDDDKNGYVDDINGWNFLGESCNEQLEYVRLLASNNTSNPRFEEAKKLHEKEISKYSGTRERYSAMVARLKASSAALLEYLEKDSFTKDEVLAIKTEDTSLTEHMEVIKQAYGFGYDSITELIEELDGYLKSLNERLDFYLNIDFDGRGVVGDDPDDLDDRDYGDNNVMPKNGSIHGTHVSGIIAAIRNNGLGSNGAANNVKIMAIRNTPNGDEYDKDVALGVYYAVDNGAKIINMSFGKSFSPHSDWVRDAIAYAAKKDVLIVAAAGNDSKKHR